MHSPDEEKSAPTMRAQQQNAIASGAYTPKEVSAQVQYPRYVGRRVCDARYKPGRPRFADASG
jgi:hypothetical protein